MQAVWIHEFGPPAVLKSADAPEPTIGDRQALVAVEASSVTFIETMVRAGKPPVPAMSPTLPTVLGNGVGGIVSRVGADIDQAWLGRRVVSTTGGSGGYAQRAAVDSDAMVAVPDPLALVDATALLADGRTAVALTRIAAPVTGEWVLVEAAAGGVGSLLVQLAVATGARVVAAAGSPAKRRVALDLGASAAVDYTAEGWADEVRGVTGGPGVDVVYDGVGGEVGRAALGAAAPGARIVVHGASSGSFTSSEVIDRQDRGLRLLGMASMGSLGLSSAELTAAALHEASSRRLRPIVGQTYPLEAAADAHAAIEERRTIGKSLLLVR